ncbi:MAG: hypothetical protein IIC22_05930, partial [Chloroflexi bacterium]|nr:hypothetical protein [Chloroflexota bacterium]
GTRAEIDDFLGETASLAKGVKKLPKAGARIGIAVETGVKTGNKLIDEVMSALTATQKKFTEQEVKRGILEHELPDYMHHMLTTEAADFLQKGGNITQFIKPIRVKLGAAKPRKIDGIIKDINENYQQKLGFNLFEDE